MQVNTVEKLASVGAFGLWAALHGWLGWLAVLYAICMLLDCVTGTALAVKGENMEFQQGSGKGYGTRVAAPL